MNGQASIAARWQRPHWPHRGYRNQFEAYVRYGGWGLCPIRTGTKAPTGKGWNRPENAISDPDQAAKLEAAGLLHAFSHTCALDIDDYQSAVAWLDERGIDLMALLGGSDAVQIVSGKPNKGKLLFSLPTPKPSVKVTGADGQVIFELRSGSADGLTVQDVLPPSLHPGTGRPYEWGGSGKWWKLPEMPADLIKVWDELGSSSPRRAERTPQHTAPARALDASAIQDLREALFTLSSDSYDMWIKVGLALSGLGDTGRGLWMAWSATSDKFDPGTAAAKWESFDGASADYRTIFAEAQQRGWTNPARERAARSRAPHPAEVGEPPEVAARQRKTAEPAGVSVQEGQTVWPEPMIPAGIDVPPLAASLLPGWVGDMAESVSAACQTPPAAAVMVVLAVLSTCCQRRFAVAPLGNRYIEPLSLWTLSALPSGSRKSAVMAPIVAPLIYWEKLTRDRMRSKIAQTAAERAVVEKRIEDLKKKAGRAESAEDKKVIAAAIQAEMEAMPAEVLARRLVAGDITAERAQQFLVEHGEQLGILSDEPGILGVMAGLYSGGAANIDVFLQGHAGSPLRVDRGGRQAHVDRPAVSMGLMIQPGILQDSGRNKRFRDSGLLARFLYAVPRSNVGDRDVRNYIDIPDEIADRWEAGVFKLLDGCLEPVTAPKILTFDPAARELWLDFGAEIERQHGAGNPLESITEWTSKLPGAVARIAGLLHLALHGPGVDVIGLDPVERATELGRLLIPHALAAFGLMGVTRQEEDSHALLRWIRSGRRLTFTGREAQRAMRARFPRKEKLDEIIAVMEDWQVIIGAKRESTGATGGRPTQTYIVNRRIFDGMGQR